MRLEDEIVQPKFENESHKATVNIFYTSNWLEAIHAEIFKPYNITRQQYNILRILRGQHPNIVNLKLIKERMIDKMSDVSRLIERLREKGLVDRKTCKSDRRHIDVCITEEGLKLLKNLDTEIKKLIELFDSLDETEIKTLNFLLDKLRDKTNFSKNKNTS
jgi:DNA-binding MarR family transcriptional regulator